MGNYTSCASMPSEKPLDDPGTNACIDGKSNINLCKNVKVVLPNGKVKEFEAPVLVKELMLENPLCFVSKPCASSVPLHAAAMPADARLEVGQLYFLFPSYVSQSGNQSPYRHKFNAPQSIILRPGKGNEMKQEIIAKGQEKAASALQNSNELSLSSGDRSGIVNSHLRMEYERYKNLRNKLWKPKLQTIGETGVDILDALRDSKLQKPQNSRMTSTL